MKISLSTLAKNAFLGKTLIGLEFHQEDKDDYLNKKITYVHVGCSESREDAGIWLTFEDRTELFVYASENLTVE